MQCVAGQIYLQMIMNTYKSKTPASDLVAAFDEQIVNQIWHPTREQSQEEIYAIQDKTP